MRRAALWKVSVRTPAPAEEAVAELLESVFGQPACIDTEVRTKTTHVTIYLEQKAALTARKQLRLLAGLKLIRRRVPEAGPGRIAVTKIPREDWAESWKRHFKPLEIGCTLLVRPSWSHRRAKPGQAVVVLDPGLSFGTGQHPTTRFCLEQLVAFRRASQAQSFLDVGVGSGILVIAAAKLGYDPVAGFDCDPDAVRIAKSNARANGVSAKVALRCQDLAQLPTRGFPEYDLICANLTSDLLLAHKFRLISRLRPNGWLVLAGVLKSQFSAVQEACQAEAVELVANHVAQEWESGVFAVGLGRV